MKDLPLLSVIVPVYNVENYLSLCIGSLADQTYANLEVLLVDDGSTDGSGAICDQWAARDSRIRVIHKENGGAGVARNLAMDLAAGELITFADSDDYVLPDMYAHLYSLMGEDADIAECGYLLFSGQELPRADAGDGNPRSYSPEEAMGLHIRDEIFQQTIWNKLYRREVLEGLRFPVGNLIDDEFFTYRAIGNARKLVHSDRRLYGYRQQAGSVMHRPYSLKRLQGLDAKLQRLDYLTREMPNLVEEGKRDLLFSCLISMQGCLRFLNGAELEAAEKKISGILASAVPVPWSREASLKRNVLLKLAQISFMGTSRMLNRLQDLHLLN